MSKSLPYWNRWNEIGFFASFSILDSKSNCKIQILEISEVIIIWLFFKEKVKFESKIHFILYFMWRYIVMCFLWRRILKLYFIIQCYKNRTRMVSLFSSKNWSEPLLVIGIGQCSTSLIFYHQSHRFCTMWLRTLGMQFFKKESNNMSGAS